MLTVPRYAALLRGVNVGGHAKLAMADLRDLVAGLGCTDVTTYVQSGNVVLSSDRSADELATLIGDALQQQLGLPVAVLVRSHDELLHVVQDNPYADADPKQLHVLFVSADPDPSLVQGFDRDRYAPEEFRVGDGVVYLRLPDGLGRSKLAAALTEKRLGVTMTARNWNTVTKLAALTAS